ncbi:hypothetical protein OQA88_4275 [Cercophora sp. LCS_1]
MVVVSQWFAAVALLAAPVSGTSHQTVIAGAESQLDILPESVAKVRKELKAAEIIPTVVNDFIPSIFVDAEWPSERASLGNTLRPEDLQDVPKILLSHHCAHSMYENSSYAMVLTDPDAPSRDNPEWSEFCHWIATGRGSDHQYSDPGCEDPVQARLEDVMPYKPPGPPKDTGKHRYVFLLLKPKNGTSEELHLSKLSDRKHWGYDTGDGETRGVRDWADENGLFPIGK